MSLISLCRPVCTLQIYKQQAEVTHNRVFANFVTLPCNNAIE